MAGSAYRPAIAIFLRLGLPATVVAIHLLQQHKIFKNIIPSIFINMMNLKIDVLRALHALHMHGQAKLKRLA